MIDRVLEQFAVGGPGWYAILLLLAIIVLVDFGRAAYGARRRSLESRQFLFLCVPILLWTALHLSLAFFFPTYADETWVLALSDTLKAFILALLCLHVWSQVSFRPITATTVVRYLTVPVVLLGIAALLYFYPNLNPGASIQDVGMQASQQVTNQGALTTEQDAVLQAGLQAGQEALNLHSLQAFLFTVFSLVILARSYLLCFNVFYQMPRHMRLSTHKLLLAISAVALVWLLDIAVTLPVGLNNALTALSYFITLYAFFAAFFIANSSNVIVTSREFVFASLSTFVITVSLKGNILDCNKKGLVEGNLLPMPRYKEPYEDYRKRILTSCNGVMSPHDENVITATINGVEQHYLFTPHNIGYHGRGFGRLVEISEITKTYSVLRYLEDIAMYDNLTGLQNRNAYIEKVKAIVTAENMPLGIIVGDVNNLKKINDTLGHLQGDQLLTTITDIINANTPLGASVFRIGGDELVLLLPRTDVETIQRFVRDVTVACAEAKDPDFGAPSISWGLAMMMDAAQDYNEVFRAADAMMYENKRRSKEVSISGVVDTGRFPVVHALKAPAPDEVGETDEADVADETEAADAPAAAGAVAPDVAEAADVTDDRGYVEPI
ncbi:MAG: GGDEF domain-containing protein [Coriobacteriales bacterium]|nr:GGDEF domain-containing protein [Coriobacteriales bacterium]